MLVIHATPISSVMYKWLPLPPYTCIPKLGIPALDLQTHTLYTDIIVLLYTSMAFKHLVQEPKGKK